MLFMLQIKNKIPEELKTCKPQDLINVLLAPTLFHIEGAKKPALFISAMLHGNEPTGLYVIQELLKHYDTAQWPRETYFFIGNVWAAKESKRRLDHQPDFNRVWRNGDLPENKMAMAVMEIVNPSSLFAVIDIHNNTGRNPHYAVVESLGVGHLNLASLFGRECLYFSEQDYTCSETLGRYCPAVTIETGQPGSVEGVAHALEFVNMLMQMEELPSKPLSELDLSVLHSFGTLRLEPRSQVGIGVEDGDICFDNDFDLMNFKVVPAGTVFGHYKNDHYLKFFDNHGNDVTETFFEHRGGKIMSRVSMVPTMLKLDKDVLKTNCVGYAMSRVDLTAPSLTAPSLTAPFSSTLRSVS